MANEDNIPTEKISVDFSDNLGDSFGIEDTQILANNDLNSFLNSDPDDVKTIEQREEEEKQKKEKEFSEASRSSASAPKDPKDKGPITAEDVAQKGKDSLEKVLFNSEKPTEENEDTKLENTNTDEDTYSILSKDLLRLGVFSKASDEETEDTISVKTPEEFLERFSLEKKKGAISILDNFLSQHGEDYRKMFDAVFVNGVSPEDYLQSFTKIQGIENIDLTVDTNQERVVRAYYKELKWDDSRIETKIQKLKDYGDLEDEAKAYHEVLLNKEKEFAAGLEQKKEQDIKDKKEKDLQNLKSLQRILGEKLKTQEIDGIPLTQKDAEEITDYLTTQKYKLSSGELLSEYDKDLLELNRPENQELKIKLGLLLKKKLDMSVVKKTALSKENKNLFTLAAKNAKQEDKRQTKSFF